MVVKQVGNRWHPMGKKGPWKSSYPTKTAAEKALRNANQYFSSQKKNTTKKPKKKTTTKKPTKKPNNPGGRKMSKGSKISPITKDGQIKVPTLLVEAGLLLGAYEEKHGHGPLEIGRETGKWGHATSDYLENVNPLGDEVSGRLIKYGVGIKLGMRLFNLNPVSIGPLLFN